MAVFEVYGGHSLKGEIVPQGAKNEALQILCAVLLTPEKVRICNVPEIVDVLQLIELLGKLGVEVERLGKGEDMIRAAEIDLEYMKTEDYRKRASRLRG